MLTGLWSRRSLPAKLFATFACLSILPMAAMIALSLEHLETIRKVAGEESREYFVALQRARLRERLSQETKGLSRVFAKFEASARALRAPAEAVVSHAVDFRFRNGSRYRVDESGILGNPPDGHSALYCPRSADCDGALVAATESLDLIMKPLIADDPRLVLAWFISEAGFARTFPWRDFRTLPTDRRVTAWPFYYLAGPGHNPRGGELFTDPYVDPLTGDWMISCVSPVMVDGQQRGTVGLDVTIEKLVREIRDIRLSPNSSSFLLSPTRIIAASENAPMAQLGLNPSRLPQEQSLTDSAQSEVAEIARRVRNLDEGVGLVELGGARALVTHSTLEPPGWKVVVFTPESDVVEGALESARTIFNETARLRRGFLHLLYFALVGVLVGTWALFAHLSRGLRSLLAGIREFGEGNLSHRLADGTGEFGRLSHALNSMAQGLQQKNLELKEAQAEVEQARKLAAVGRLAAGVAHEVNNPLATISTCTQLLLRGGDLGPDAVRRLERIRGEIERLQEKLRNLLDLSRVQSPVKTLMDPNQAVREVADLARHEAAARGLRLDLDLADGSSRVLLDRSGVKQILWNLLSNAVDASPEGGRILVRTRFASGGEGTAATFAVEVEDEGPGIPEDALPRIFEPFFTTKEVGQGTGLGLAVAHRIARDHAGRIDVENLEPRGCRFRVVLPEGREP